MYSNHSQKNYNGVGRRRMTTEEFVNRAKNLFSNYDYSLVRYIKTFIKVDIICPKHGKFSIRPNTILSAKHGCPKCGYELSSKKHSYTREDFIKKAKHIFPLYDYSNIEYINLNTDINIICPKHGVFSKKPRDILRRKSGCQKCHYEHLSSIKRKN